MYVARVVQKLESVQKNSYTNDKVFTKAEFTHPVYACVYRIALQFFITYIGFAQLM